MDEIRRLEREISSLQSQLRQQNSEAAKARQRLIDDNKRALDAYQQQMRQAISSHDKDTQAEYERLLSEYQRNVSADVQTQLAMMDVSYRQLVEDVHRKEEELRRKNQQLEQAITAIRQQVSDRSENSKREAKDHLVTATGTFRTIEVKPHQKFVPNRLRIFYNAIRDGQQLYQAGLFEAATAVAISAKAGLERLGYTIDDQVAEWDKQYDLFQRKLSYLQMKIRQELTDWETLIGESSDGDREKRKAHLIDINFWTQGEFGRIVHAARKYQDVLTQVDSVGKDAYLKRPDSAGTEELKKYIAEVEQLDKSLQQVSSLYKRRYEASCQRADWGEQIIDFLTGEIDLTWVDGQTGFREAEPEVRRARDYVDYVGQHFPDRERDEDIRQWLKLVFTNASENPIYIYILPLEAHGNVVNHIVIHIDYGGPEQELYSRDIYRHVCEAIHYEEGDGDVVDYAADINELKVSNNKAFSDTGRDLEKMRRSAV